MQASVVRPLSTFSNDFWSCEADSFHIPQRSVRVAERLALPTSVHGVAGSNPAGGEILFEPKWRFIAQSLSCSPFHRLEMTEILLKGRKTLIHPSIHIPHIASLGGGKEYLCFFYSNRITTLVAMEAYSFHWLIMGKVKLGNFCCLTTDI